MATRRAYAVPHGFGRLCDTVPGLCRDCLTVTDADRCAACDGTRIVRHPELFDLTIAHIDCDAFYASVEKRDRPDLAARPVIVGGGVRGVVTAACYVARIYGVHSAMPMFKALKACPDAVVIRPDFGKYVAVGRQIRALMGKLTPLLQPLSIDEAVLDLAGTEALHGAPPAVVLARFAREVEATVGVTVSIGLAPNRLLAKIAAGRDKPRGFTVIGASEAASLLAPEPVRLLPGVGPALARRLSGHGITLLGHLQALTEREAHRRLGDEGPALVRRARGQDDRRVDPGRETKSISAETTFDSDLTRSADLERHLWRLGEKLAQRLRENELCAGGVVLKLKTATFTIRTRAARLPSPTVLPDRLFEAGRNLLAREATGTAFRLIGLGASPLLPLADADHGDLADLETPRRAAAQAAIDAVRQRFGAAAISRGRGWESVGAASRPPPARRGRVKSVRLLEGQRRSEFLALRAARRCLEGGPPPPRVRPAPGHPLH
jgi:DNA polymerase-4